MLMAWMTTAVGSGYRHDIGTSIRWIEPSAYIALQSIALDDSNEMKHLLHSISLIPKTHLGENPPL
jgi:hypothetical protein